MHSEAEDARARKAAEPTDGILLAMRPDDSDLNMLADTLSACQCAVSAAAPRLRHFRRMERQW